jgi:hypothetical protein
VRERAGDEATVNAIALEEGELDGELGWTINTSGTAAPNRVFHAAPDGTVEPGL